MTQLLGRGGFPPVPRRGREDKPARVSIPVAALDDAIDRLLKLHPSSRDPERFPHDKLDLVREMRGWKR